MTTNQLKARAYLVATTTVTTALAIHAFAAPHNQPD